MISLEESYGRLSENLKEIVTFPDRFDKLFILHCYRVGHFVQSFDPMKQIVKHQIYLRAQRHIVTEKVMQAIVDKMRIVKAYALAMLKD